MKVRGTQPHNPSGIQVDVDTVYVRSDAIFIDTEEFKGWEYNEEQYRKDEYIRLISEENEKMSQRQDATDEMLLSLLMEGMNV